MFIKAIDGKSRVSADCEGVNLSRFGSVTLVSIGISMPFGTVVFLFDLLLGAIDKKLHDSQMKVLKKLLEDKEVEKIMHDCRQDADALSKCQSIELINVWDTQVIYQELRDPNRGLNLNDTLEKFGCPKNLIRGDSASKYRTNERYWETRPLSREMLDCAAGDVVYLFDLYHAQQKEVNHPSCKITIDKIKTKCIEKVDAFRSCRFDRKVSIPSDRIGLVIGRNGCTIRSIEKQSGAIVTRCSSGEITLLGHTEKQLNTAEKLVKDRAFCFYQDEDWEILFE